ncbi:MAG: hypothetical protein QOE23_47 [Pseudonocardiales bacterium]|nr:hypothetical protein [Pseudonocardiales bacterium]
MAHGHHGAGNMQIVRVILPECFDQFWAVVLLDYAGAGRRLLWSPAHRTWLPNRAYTPGFVEQPLIEFAPQPYSEDVDAVPEIAARLVQRRVCYRCGATKLFDHFIAPDVLGNASMYCVQLPDPSVVASSGGSGQKKHWGTMLGCSAVKQEFWINQWGTETVRYGNALIANDVRDYDWCARCTSMAANIAGGSNEPASVDQYATAYEHDLLEERAKNRRLREAR